MKRLTDQDCAAIVALMSSFRGPITWADVIGLGEEVSHQRYSRQSLEKKDDIRSAYRVVNERAVAQPVLPAKPKPAEVQVLEATVERLSGRIAVLEGINTQLKEQFVVWAENARMKGLTEDDLNRPLSKLHRRGSYEEGDQR
jgi:hypothetical protein